MVFPETGCCQEVSQSSASAELIAFGGGHFLVLINSQESDTYKPNANLQREIEMLMRLNCFVDMVSMILPEDIYTQKLNSNQKMA